MVRWYESFLAVNPDLFYNTHTNMSHHLYKTKTLFNFAKPISIYGNEPGVFGIPVKN